MHRVWSDFESQTGRWEVRVRFNHQVYPSNLTEAMAVTVNGVSQGFALVDSETHEAATEPGTSFSVVSEKPMETPGTVKIVAKKGLTDVSGRVTLEKSVSYEFMPVETASVTQWTTFYKSKNEKGLELRFSRYVPDRALRDAIKITPEVRGFNVSAYGPLGLRITGDFTYEKEYTLQVAATKIADARVLLEAREITFKGPGLKADISSKTDRSVIELQGKQLLPLMLSNVTKVRCVLESVPPYLALEAQESNLADRVKSLEKARGLPAVFLRPVTEDAEVFFAPEALDHVLGYSLPLSFRKNPDRGGVWNVQLSDPDGNFREEASKVVQITDMAISYKISTDNLLFWVTSLHTGLPVAGAEVLVYGDGGLRFVVGKTDKSGVLFLERGKKFPALVQGREAAGPSPHALRISHVTAAVAATAHDSCYIELKGNRLKPVGVKQTEKLTEKVEPLTGYLFTERGVYRPGETVNFKCYSRMYKDRHIVSPTGAKVKLEITDPRNDVVYSKVLQLSEYGTAHDSLNLETFFPTGAYTLTATLDPVAGTNGAKEVFSRSFLVQEYKRPRHFVTMSFTPGERAAQGYVGVKMKEEFLAVDVQAQYYTGGPVKHARVRWKADLAPASHKVAGYDAYSFGNEDDNTLFLESGEALTDGNGKLNLTIPLDPRLLTGIYGVNVSATVLDIDGEPATEVGTYRPRPRFLVGISGHPRQVPEGYSSPLRLIVVDQEGKKVPDGKLKASILQQKYFYTQKRDDAGNVNYLWDKGWMKTASSQLAVSKGESLFDFQLNDYGDYLLTFTYEDKTGVYSSQTLFKVGWEQYEEWLRERRDTDVRTADSVFVATTKKEYRTGEPVRISFHTPRPVKKCLVTLEKGGVLEYRVIDVNGTDGSYEFSTRDTFQPNVYASVIAAAGREGYPVYQSQVDMDVPTVFYGYADITVRTDSKKFRVDIDPSVPELTGKPAEKKTLAFSVTDDKGQGARAELVVCVVDEAVLALTRFKTPELSSLSNFNLPLTVFSGDLRLALVSQDLFRLFSTRPLTGGDAGLGKVSGSLKLRKDFRPVAYFNPSVHTDTAGRATIEFELPDSTTAYRVYAVACDKGSGFASAERNMVVTKEFFVEPSPPRFLIPGDRVTFPVSLNNKTAEKGDVFLEAGSSPNLKLALSKTAVEVHAWATTAVEAMAEALGGADRAVVRFTGELKTKAGNFGDAIEQTFPIHSRYLPVNRAIMGGFSRHKEIPVDLPTMLKKAEAGEITPADFHAHISLSTTNWTRLAPGLKYLLQYPFGCVEQTSSGVIPLAGIRGLVNSGLIPGITTEQVDTYLKSGVERLLSMQVSDGGFSYWPGENRSSWWGTMYATFALSGAKQAGHPVPEKNLKSALQYMHNTLFKKNEKDPYHGQAWTREFALINLAIGGMLSSSDLERFFADYGSLSDQSKALLLLAAKKTSYLPDDKIGEMLDGLKPGLDPAKRDYYNSSVREISVCLMAAEEIGAAPDKADAWAGYLLRSIQPDGKWNSTCDTGWALLALSRYYQGKDTGKSPKIRIRIDCGDGKPAEVELADASVYAEIPARALLDKGTVVVDADSDTLVNYTISVTYPDLATDPAQLEKGFVLEKKMENLNGKEEIRVGDIVRVTLFVSLPGSGSGNGARRLEYMALEDPVPAGLVPISSDLKTEGVDKQENDTSDSDAWRDGYYWLNPTRAEFREDGVRVFKNQMWDAPYRYSYLARAVAEGDFWMRGSRVSLMYEPDRFGKTVGRRVTVLPAGK
jgi:alpha-2-macroglobulin